MNNGDFHYIHDGYTRRGYIAEIPRLYPALRFAYRPMLSQDRSVVSRRIQSETDARKTESIVAATIKGRLVEWDAVKHDGAPVPLDVPEILRIHPAQMTKLFRIVIGDMPSDEDPLASEDERDEFERELEASIAGTSVEEADAKN